MLKDRGTTAKEGRTCSVWKVPFLPVRPWQITFVFLSTNTAGLDTCSAAVALVPSEGCRVGMPEALGSIRRAYRLR